MSTLAKISSDIKDAMRAREKVKLGVLRMVLSEIKYAQANVNVHQELPEAETLKVINTYHKRLAKSIAEYPDPEKKAEIQAEIDIVESYLPKKATEEETLAAINEVVGSSDEKNFGILMKSVLAKLGDAAEGKTVSKLLKEKLN